MYRLVVTASPHKARQFAWMIVDDNHRNTPVQTSKGTFRSMEDARNAGKGALEYWQGQIRRTNSAVDVAQPVPIEKANEKLELPGSSFISSKTS
jgi:hypothetical protein